MKNLPSEDLKFNHSYVCKLINSTVYTIEIAKQNDKAYVKCRAEFTDKTPIVKEQREESEEELKAKEEKLLARDAAEEFNQKHGGWIYELSNWQMKNLTKDMADLLEDLPEEKPAEPEAQPAPTEPVEEPAPPQESTPPAETDASK
jgi:septum formation inhibitor MinC